MPNFISEDQIEQALVQKLQQLYGFETLNCYTENPEDLRDGSGRAHKREVILIDRVKETALRLNPHIPPKAIDEALEKLLDRRVLAHTRIRQEFLDDFLCPEDSAEVRGKLQLCCCNRPGRP